jgi:hypothetical protein
MPTLLEHFIGFSPEPEQNGGYDGAYEVVVNRFIRYTKKQHPRLIQSMNALKLQDEKLMKRLYKSFEKNASADTQRKLSKILKINK